MGQVEQFLEQFSKFTLYQGIGGCTMVRMRITIRVELFKSYRNIKGKPSSGRLIKIGPSLNVIPF